MKSQLVKALRNIEGLDVFDDEMSLEIYSQDASIFHIRPLAVAWPRSCDDLEKIVNLCKIEGVAIIARGAATSVTGAPLGSGLCLDFTRHMNRLISIDPLTQSAWVEPGLVQDRLNEAASLYNLRLGPDTSTGNRATIGGMIGNNSAGAHSLTYGMMSKHLEAVEVVLSSGRRVLLEKEHDRQKALADPDLCPIVHWQEKWHKRQSELSFAKVSRNSHGYLIQELLQAADSKTLNMAGAFCASEGTLGLISKAKLRLCPKAQQTSLWLLGYNSLEEAFEDAPKLAKLKPYACELIDEHILEASRKSPDPAMRHIKWIHGSEKAFIGFEVQQDSAIASSTIDEQKLSLFSSKAISRRQLLSSPEQQEFWAVRKSGVGLLMSRKSADKAIAFIEDLTLPLESISLFLKGLRHLLSEEKKRSRHLWPHRSWMFSYTPLHRPKR